MRIKLSLLSFVFLLSSCVTGPEGYLKKSANNKYIDMRGFQGQKRAPLYNNKYVSKAKRNVEDYDEFSEEEMEGILSARQKNIEAYREMAEEEEKRNRKKRSRSRSSDDYRLHESKKQISNYSKYRNMELEDEIHQIKKMLNETKKELENSRCSTASSISHHKHGQVKSL